MKAYRVHNTWDDWQELVYANHHNTAKWEVAAAYDTVCGQTIYPVLRAYRLPDMDGYGDPFAKRGYIEHNRNLQRLSGIYRCEHCGSKNADGDLMCADCNQEDCRCDQPPMPAASPWRYDVENAPKDGSELIIEAQGEREVFRAVAKWSSIHSFWATGLGVMLQDSDIRAFATINLPEIPHALGE